MAGGTGVKMDPKILKNLKNGSNSEVLKDSSDNFLPQKQDNRKVFTISGILGLNQTLELNKKSDSNEKVLWGVNHLEQEQKLLYSNRQQELEKAIEELRDEIRKLIAATGDLEKDVVQAAFNPVVEYTEYQVKFFQRLKNFIAVFRKNISEAGVWLESFNSKKKKRNYFWNTVKSKKGGDQYLFSDEHSVARSAT